MIVFAVMVIQSSLTEAASSRSKQCTYSGYAPGRPVPQITRISAKKPEAFEENVLKNVLGIGETAVEVTEKALELSHASPQLALTFGAIAIALGIAQSEPSPRDILDRAHESIQFLANDVNERLNQLQDYSNVKDLQLQREVMTRNYKELFDQWQECLTYQTKTEADKCQERVERAVESARYQFQPLQSLFDDKDYDPNFPYRYAAGTWQWMNTNEGAYVNFPEYDEAKQLEIKLLPFRNYATLHLLGLQTLIKTYEAQGKDGCTNLKYYLNRMVERSDYYVRYARWAYEWIYIRQYEENVYFGIKGRAGGGPASADRGGFLGTMKCSGSTCTVECTQIIKDNVCTFNNGGPRQAAMEMTKICETYLAQVKKQLTTFWQDHLLDVVKIWKSTANKPRINWIQPHATEGTEQCSAQGTVNTKSLLK